jgi:hypothetical protein
VAGPGQQGGDLGDQAGGAEAQVGGAVALVGDDREVLQVPLRATLPSPGFLSLIHGELACFVVEGNVPSGLAKHLAFQEVVEGSLHEARPAQNIQLGSSLPQSAHLVTYLMSALLLLLTLERVVGPVLGSHTHILGLSWSASFIGLLDSVHQKLYFGKSETKILIYPNRTPIFIIFLYDDQYLQRN